MGFEIDFRPVGEGERSGDAIAFRLLGVQTQFVGVIDGGTKDSGAALVQHIKQFYNTGKVDIAICSHSDADHASGLTEVLENLDVGQLWMHLPWNHSAQIAGFFKDGHVSGASLRERFKRELECARELETIARRRGTGIVEPFSDTINAAPLLRVLSPSTTFYEGLLPKFRIAPEPHEAAVVAGFRALLGATAETVAPLPEAWGVETLLNPSEDATSAENWSSSMSSTFLLQRS